MTDFNFKNMRLGDDMKAVTVITTDRDLFDAAWEVSFADDMVSVFPCRLISVEVCLEIKGTDPCHRELYRLARYANERDNDTILMFYERRTE